MTLRGKHQRAGGLLSVATDISFNLFNILALIAFAYCVVKIFFQNIKRGGILLVQMAVGALYMFSVPAATRTALTSG